MRVSPSLQPDVLAGLQQSQASLQTALQQLSTGRRVNLPSDDPTASAALVQNLAASSSNDQYTRNTDSALGQVQLADSILSSVTSLLTSAITLGTQGATSTNSASNRQAIATQVQGILSSIVSQANTTYQGSALFGGTRGVSSAFVADPTSPAGYTYQGDSGVSQVQAGNNLSIQLNVPGDQLFTNSNASVLGALSQLVSALNSGTSAAIGTATAAVTASLNYVSSQHAVFGGSINQLTSQQSFLGQEKITLSSQASTLVGIDPAAAAENLAQAQSLHGSILAAAAKVLPTSLLDYLK